MFMLYALPLGAAAGWLLGGRLVHLAELRVRWAALAAVGLLLQVILFFGPVAERVGAAGMPLYVGSSALVLAAVLRNLAVPGLPLVAAGGLANLLAIAANGGYMPAAPSALAALGREIGSAYSNSTVVAEPALAPLTDVFALPAWLPFANVFSIGDVLIGAGIAWALAAGMRRPVASGNIPPTFGPDQYPRAIGGRSDRG